MADKGGDSASGTVSAGLDAVESGLDGSGTPQRGGQLVYGLEAEATKGYCLPQSELAISGMQVARSLYDTLTVPDAKGGYAPYLAKTVTPSADYRTWTIFRNQPGEDPDMNRVWWYDGSTNPVNFGRFDDPIIDRALDTGRQTADKGKRRAGYEAINRQFAKEVWNVYLWFTPWTVAEAANVHGILGPNLPGDGGPPSVRLVTGHSLLGIWIDRR